MASHPSIRVIGRKRAGLLDALREIFTVKSRPARLSAEQLRRKEDVERRARESL